MELTATDVNRREIYRYLGYRGMTPDDTIMQMVEEVLQDLFRVICPRNIYQIYECSINEHKIYLENGIQRDGITIQSRNLSDNLSQCEKVILMAASLGIGADKLLQRYEITNIAKASVLQACGAACIEAYCNLLQEEIRQQMQKEGMYLRPRFSPGYGDLPLDTQQIVFDCLQCTKRLGLTLTDSLLMYPTKSVTAFIGITKNKQSCHIAKCSTCENTGCEFRYED